MLGYIAQTAATEELLGNPAIQFKTAQFNWIGRIGSYNNITIFWHTSKIKTVARRAADKSTIGATGVGSAVYIYPNMMNKILGTKFKIVSGYQGTAQTSLAMERGEVEGVTMGWFPVKTGKTRVDHGEAHQCARSVPVERHPDLPDVPTIVELARTPEEKQLFTLFANDGDVGKAMLLPPDVPGYRGDHAARLRSDGEGTATSSPTPTRLQVERQSHDRREPAGADPTRVWRPRPRSSRARRVC